MAVKGAWAAAPNTARRSCCNWGQTFSDRIETDRAMTRVQGLVIAVFAFAWMSLLLILIGAPDVYDRAVALTGESRRIGETLFLFVLSAFIVLLRVGVIRRWRWTFWLILVAFLAGVLRVPASFLGIGGNVSTTGPAWYVVFQGVVGIVQFAIGLVMLAGWRPGAWSDI